MILEVPSNLVFYDSMIRRIKLMVAYMHIRFGFWLETLIPDLCQGVHPHQNGVATANSIFPHLGFILFICFDYSHNWKIGRHGTKPRTKDWHETKSPLRCHLFLSVRSVHPRGRFPGVPTWDKTLFQKKSGSGVQLPKPRGAGQCWMVSPVGSRVMRLRHKR